MKLTLLQFRVQLVLDEPLEDGSNLLHMVSQGVRINQDIVDVHYYVSEHVVYEQLEDGRTVRQAERHDQIFIVPCGGGEGRLPLVPLPVMDEVVRTA